MKKITLILSVAMLFSVFNINASTIKFPDDFVKINDAGTNVRSSASLISVGNSEVWKLGDDLKAHKRKITALTGDWDNIPDWQFISLSVGSDDSVLAVGKTYEVFQYTGGWKKLANTNLSYNYNPNTKKWDRDVTTNIKYISIGKNDPQGNFGTVFGLGENAHSTGNLKLYRYHKASSQSSVRPNPPAPCWYSVTLPNNEKINGVSVGKEGGLTTSNKNNSSLWITTINNANSIIN